MNIPSRPKLLLTLCGLGILAAAGSFLFFFCAQDEPDLWQRFIEPGEGDDRGAYAQSLSPEEFMRAGRQGARSIEASYPREQWDEPACGLLMLLDACTVVGPRQIDTELALKELRRKRNPELWRRALGARLARTVEDPREYVDILECYGSVLADRSDLLSVRSEVAARWVTYRALRVPEARDEQLSSLHARLAQTTKEFVQVGLDAFLDATTPSSLRRWILYGWVECHKHQPVLGSEVVRDAVARAMGDCLRIPEAEWRELARVARRDLELPGGRELTLQMMRKAKEETTRRDIRACLEHYNVPPDPVEVEPDRTQR